MTPNKINDVSASLWISASAGTGKTQSLINRILALLLNGVQPSKILCLTYTNAAASEMLNRLSDVLRGFSLATDEELKSKLSSIGFGESYIKTARSLYERSVDSPWVSIQTIHSFCFRLLKFFPLETGLYPNVKLCDDRQQDQLLDEAVKQVLADVKFKDNWKVISDYATDISSILKNNAIKIQRHLAQAGDFKKQYAVFLDVNEDWLDLSDREIDSLLFEKSFQNNYRKVFAELAEELSRGGAEDGKKAEILRENSIAPSERFVDAFLTREGEIRSRLCSKKIDSAVGERMREIAEIAFQFSDIKKRVAFAKANVAFWEVMSEIVDKFRELKESNHCVDFDDVILLSLVLLNNIDWVMFKIDSGLSHLLVDEAQDTNPEQWEIIEKITSEFFSNYQSDKTIFVVGDEKQSIFSFQGADVKKFRQMRELFKEKAEGAGQKFYDVPLNKSYRTTGNILSFVDKTLAEKFAGLSHSTNRDPNAGVVEIVDIPEKEESEEYDAGKKVAAGIADIVKNAIENKIFVESRDRPAMASDFLILFQRRDNDEGRKTMEYVIRALKNENIPVTEADRVLLNDEPIVEDLIALAEFCVFPPDDLTCARVLKSPIVGMTESELMQVCLDRKDDCLWDYIKENERVEKLRDYVDRALKLSTFDFFASVLADGTREKLIGRLGERSLDALNEFLAIVMNYERENSPSPQNFLEWFRSSEFAIKRESFADQNAVRLMTVHASKGLQAPFVILADASHYGANRKEDLLRSEDGFLFWNISDKRQPQIIKRLREIRQSEKDDEYYRLFYVALTRAEDFLYVVGEKDKSGEKSWRAICNSL
ncbi:MAG: UvrD-helicase domain-containing protein [Holosporaceae bacterium]|jgi:ATP-dependent helicase/nuclease subunit A|nr:UvrD-helicase domain-containing protein [Holosporaceae bacterium]